MLERKVVEQQFTRIPRDRIAVLIGRKGSTRRELESITKSNIEIDSETGDVRVTWSEDPDPIHVLKLPNLIQAIGRGMPPSKAVELLGDETMFELLDIRQWVGKRSNQQRRMRSRIIGRNGRIRATIEDHTGCEICVYGHTIALIGDVSGLSLARNSLEMLLNGSEHSSVLRFLEKRGRERRQNARSLDTISERDDPLGRFDALVPGLSLARNRHRRLKATHVDIRNQEEVEAVMELEGDESIIYAEE